MTTRILLATTWLLSITLLPAALGQTTEWISVTAAGTAPSGFSKEAAVSGDGRFVAFQCGASDLGTAIPAGDGLYVRDRQLGVTSLVSVSSAGVPAAGGCQFPSLTADGRFIAFQAYDAGLVPGDANAAWDVFLRDQVLGTTVRASLAPGGLELNGSSFQPALTPDGRYLAFVSQANNAVPGFSGTLVYRRDLWTDQLVVASPSATGTSPNGACGAPAISADGRFVAFESDASDLVAGDANGFRDVFVRDLLLGTTEIVSIATFGTPGNDDSRYPALSADGNEVAFYSEASLFVPGDPIGSGDVFVRDRAAGTTTDVNTGGGSVPVRPAISADGRLVAFASVIDTAAGDSNGLIDVYLFDRLNGQTSALSLTPAGTTGIGHSPAGGHASGNAFGLRNALSMSADGLVVGFDSSAYDFVAGDNGFFDDVFARVRACEVLSFAYGPGLAGAGGSTPYLAGVEGACAGGWALVAANVLGGAPGLFVAGVAKAEPAIAFAGGLLHVNPAMPYLVLPIAASGAPGTPGAGTWILSGIDTTLLHGATFFQQALFLDGGAPQGWSLTNALETHF